MKAITLRQPWAGLLVLGFKKNETRSWPTKHRGEITVTSSKKMEKDGIALLKWLSENVFGFSVGSERYKTCSILGVALGTVEITDVHSSNDAKAMMEHVTNSAAELRFGNYEPDRYFYTCINPVLFQEPFPVKGSLNVWKMPE